MEVARRPLVTPLQKEGPMSSASMIAPLQLDATTQAFVTSLAAQGGPPLYTPSPADARAVLTGVQSSVRVNTLPADVEDRTIPRRLAPQVSIRLIRPRGVSGALPI